MTEETEDSKTLAPTMTSLQYAALQNSYELHETIGSGDSKRHDSFRAQSWDLPQNVGIDFIVYGIKNIILGFNHIV